MLNFSTPGRVADLIGESGDVYAFPLHFRLKGSLDTEGIHLFISVPSSFKGWALPETGWISLCKTGFQFYKAHFLPKLSHAFQPKICS